MSNFKVKLALPFISIFGGSTEETTKDSSNKFEYSINVKEETQKLKLLFDERGVCASSCQLTVEGALLLA